MHVSVYVCVCVSVSVSFRAEAYVALLLELELSFDAVRKLFCVWNKNGCFDSDRGSKAEIKREYF